MLQVVTTHYLCNFERCLSVRAKRRGEYRERTRSSDAVENRTDADLADNRRECPARTQSAMIDMEKKAMTYDDSNPFAKILRGELPCIKVAETDAALAFMDLMPQADGHLLVVPKEAAAEIFDLSDAATVACIRMTQKLAIAVRAALRPDGVFIGQFNGAAAGQTVPHVHFHVIPRWEGQPLRMHARDMADADTLEALAKRIRAHWRAD